MQLWGAEGLPPSSRPLCALLPLPIPLLTLQDLSGISWAASAPLTCHFMNCNVANCWEASYLVMHFLAPSPYFPKFISNFSICCKNLDRASTWQLTFVASNVFNSTFTRSAKCKLALLFRNPAWDLPKLTERLSPTSTATGVSCTPWEFCALDRRQKHDFQRAKLRAQMPLIPWPSWLYFYCSVFRLPFKTSSLSKKTLSVTLCPS